MPHRTDDDNTPRMSGLSAMWLRGALDLRRSLLVGALAYQKRPDLGHNYRAAARCSALAERADTLAVGIDSWAAGVADEEARARDVDAFIRLQEEAAPLLAGLRSQVGDFC